MEDYQKKTLVNFLTRETIAGFLLIISTIVALVLSNTSLSGLYRHCVEDTFIISLTSHFTINLTVGEWINDGLMVIFFTVAGLEIKREVSVGHFSTWRKALLPLIAALGGMIVPALIFIVFNYGTEKIGGWGIPMATDIAYSLGILALISKRVPIQLKIFLTALAIADDLGAILVIAVAYSSDVSLYRLGLAALCIVILISMNRLGIKHLLPYVIVGIFLWLSFLDSGIHPTISGVLFAMTIPVKSKITPNVFTERLEVNLSRLRHLDFTKDILTDKEQQATLSSIGRATSQSRPPLLRLENHLSGFNSYIIIPLFALANAGVNLDINFSTVLNDSIGMGVIFGLVLGKVIGIFSFSYIGVKARIAELPKQLKWNHIFGMGLLAGIGFTMSLFITNIAYSNPYLIKVSKISILSASLASALLGLTFLILLNRD